MTYGQVYGNNVKNIDAQIEWCKTNGKGKLVETHMWNLTQLRAVISDADHAGSTIG